MASTVAPCYDICSSTSPFCSGPKSNRIALDSTSTASSVEGGLALIRRTGVHQDVGGGGMDGGGCSH